MVLEAAKGTDVQLYVSTFYQEGGNPEFDAGIKEYINTASGALDANGGNDTVAAVTAMGYDAYYVALEAIKKADSVDPAPSRPLCGMWSMTACPATSPLTTPTATPCVTPPTSSTPPTTVPGSWRPSRR